MNFIRSAFAVSAFLLLAVTSSFGDPKGETVTVKGKVVDLACANAGKPTFGLVTEKGSIFVITQTKERQPGTEGLLSKVSKTVTVEGTLVKEGGLQVVYMKTLK